MDLNWKVEEVLMTIRDGIQLTPAQEARMQLAQERHPAGGLRRAAASALVALARRLDPDSKAAWLPKQAQPRPASPA